MKHNANEISDAFWQKKEYQKEGITIQGNAEGSKLFMEGLLYAELAGKKFTLNDRGHQTATVKLIFSGLLKSVGAKPITGKKIWRHGKDPFVPCTKTITEWRNA